MSGVDNRCSALMGTARPFEEPDLNLDQALIWITSRNSQFVNEATDRHGDSRRTWMALRACISQTAKPALVWMRPCDAEEALLLALQENALEPQPGQDWAGPIWFNRAWYGHSLSSTWFVHCDGGGLNLGPRTMAPRFDALKLLAIFPQRDVVAYEVLQSGRRGSSSSGDACDLAAAPNLIAPLKRNRGGRKPGFDWPQVKAFVFKLFEHHGAPTPDDPDLPSQEAVVGRVLEFCETRFGRQPSSSRARDYVSRWLKEYERRT